MKTDNQLRVGESESAEHCRKFSCESSEPFGGADVTLVGCPSWVHRRSSLEERTLSLLFHDTDDEQVDDDDEDVDAE